MAPGIVVTAWHVLDGLGARDVGATITLSPLAGGATFRAEVVRVAPLST